MKNKFDIVIDSREVAFKNKMSKPINWNKEELERLILIENMSYSDIAPLFGAKDGSAVGKAARRLGIEVPIRTSPKGSSKYSKEELEYYLYHEGLTLAEISKIYGIKSIWGVLKKLGLIKNSNKWKPDFSYKSSVNNYNEDGSINNDYLPVPLEYTYPICMKIEVFWKGDNRGQDLLYIPEENIWVRRYHFRVRERKGKSDYTYWLNRWVVRAKDPENLTEEEIDRLISIKYNDKFPHTKEYIKSQLLVNSRYECDFFCTREDLIEVYPKSRIGKGQFLFNYNFDKVPDFIKTTMEKFEVSYCEEINGEVISGSFTTCFRDFIKQKVDPIELSRKVNKLGATTRMTNEEFLRRAKEVHGDLYEYLDNIDEVLNNKYDKIRIRCKRCGRIFKQRVLYHLRGSGCKYCNSKYRDMTNLHLAGQKKVIPFEEFVRRAREIHGNRYEYFEDSYTDISSKTKIRDTITGDIFYQQAYCHCHGQRNPHLHNSIGEDYVEKWLKENYPDLYQKEVRLIGIVEGRNTNEIRPDFILKVNGIEFWIEYHGKQHYLEMPFFHKTHEDFLKQLKRDQNERDYCKENGIILIEISYEYNTYEKVVNFLEEHIKNVL